MAGSWKEWQQNVARAVGTVAHEAIAQLGLLLDRSQVNRRIRAAWRDGRTARGCYLLMSHQRRRLARRREIRHLVEGPVARRFRG